MTPSGLILILALAPAPAQDASDSCLGCHSDPALTLTLPTGQVRSLTVDAEAFARSVHGARLSCTDCHAGQAEYPHPERKYRTPAEYRAPFREACKSCHFENYTRMVDSVHYKLLPQGDPRAPSCSDCHGAHDVTPPGQPRAALSRTCAKCHQGVYDTYAKSVHGQALLDRQSADAPVCTDCHRSHALGGPHDAAWLLESPQLCGNCHADEKKMAPYGLSTRVLKTYLADFHGMSASLSSAERPEEARLTALCTDCHGVHDIARVDDPGSRVVKANLVKTCRRCHEGATDSFPAAWLSHYEPSLKKAPLVWMVQAFYWVFIPFVIGGLVLQIVLHFWRLVVNR
jgi:nitrate/TMAO reductase-like tetraheme cytochrome c subunit